MLLKVKYDNTNSIANINSFSGILVLYWMYNHLLLIPSMARSRGTLVNKTITSRESSTSELLTVTTRKRVI